MGLFDKLPGMQTFGDIKEQRAAEQRDRNFTTQRDIFAVGSQPDDEHYLEKQERNELIRWQQDLDDELIELVQALLGYRKVEGSWKKVTEPLCDEKFVHEVVIPQCQPFMSRNLINSRFEEKRILLDLKCTCDDIVDAMAENHDYYGIDFINFDLILRLIKNTIKPGPYRALKGWTKELDSKSTRRIESTQFHEEQQRKKLLGVI